MGESPGDRMAISSIKQKNMNRLGPDAFAEEAQSNML